jgi:beta-barrel assembly-enhancing protease
MGIFDRHQADTPSRGSGFKGRLIGAILLALIGWAMYMSQVEENPVTGERQHVAISPDQEVRLGLETAPEMSREMGGELPAYDRRTQIVQRLGKTLVDNTQAKKSPWKFQFHLLADNETVNAFALPGGQIFITLGLFNRLDNEAELTGVLSHEMGHVIERHTAQQMATSQLGQWLVVAVATGTNDSDSYGTNSTPFMIASLVNQMIQLRYSRQDESQADTWGLKLMEEIGFNPRAMIDVMEILKAAGGRGAPLAIFQTHPDPDLRIQQIKAYLTEHPPPPNLTVGRKLKDLY